MPEIIIDVLPIRLDQPGWSERFEKTYENGIYSMERCCQQHMKWVVLSIFLISIVGGIVIIIINNNKLPDYPCMSYSQESLASSVSVACLQYMWMQSCSVRAPYTFSATYVGWWNQSPEGATMVSCNGLKKGSNCGVGSYLNMITYMQYCNINLNQ